MTFAITDTHCDVLWKMWEHKLETFSEHSELTVTPEKLKKGGVKKQVFAIFDPVFLGHSDGWPIIKKQLELFQNTIATNQTLADEQITPLLSLEGAMSLGDDEKRWERLYDSNIIMASLTWNEKNELATGCKEDPTEGLTEKGRLQVKRLFARDIALDVSHLNEQGFWDVLALEGRVLASHSNARALCDHPRNLRNEQIQALAEKQGFIGLVWHPLFLNGSEEAACDDIGRHIDHVAGLGGKELIGFGSDFDGTTLAVTGLEDPSGYCNLIEWLIKRYKEEDVRAFTSQNFERFLNNG